MTYLITFGCYGFHLHGDESGSVDGDHNLPGSRLARADQPRTSRARERMHQEPYTLDHESREAVLEVIREVCSHRGWHLLAAHVRTNHVHTVVVSEAKPEKVMNDFKSYASRSLNRLGRDGPDRLRWAHHGSTRWLWKDQNVQDAIRYVLEAQGEAMSVYVGELR